MLDEVITSKREQLKRGDVKNDTLEENERDLLTLMIESELRGEGILSDEELKANLCLFFFAGHDTTTSALSFALYHLAKHPVSFLSSHHALSYIQLTLKTRKSNKEQEKKQSISWATNLLTSYLL
jgi:cytochrome P450